MARPLRRPGNLPAEATSFIGRRHELAELRKKLTTARLVSLVGPGGVGKTRLAIRIAGDLRRAFPGGAWLVELADLRDPGLVDNAVLAALDLRDQAPSEPLSLLLAHLRDKEMLIVLDNCEHLLGAAAQLVTHILKAAPGVRVVATSREPLSVSGEHVLPVPPLELPEAETTNQLGKASHNEAVMLFVERAAAASGSFDLTASNGPAIVDLCRRLDGLPLAIELAAVRTRALTVAQILDRLTDRFALLTGGSRAALPRHQTLRTTVEWSYELLAADERVLLRRLCVFAGRFTLEDVESVCTSADVPATRGLDVLSSLVDKSLVVMEEVRGLACYRLHETMREYTGLKLREAGEEDAVALRRTAYYRAKCRFFGVVGMLEWLAWMDLEIDNVRVVLRDCVTRADYPSGIDLAGSLLWYWTTRATTEGARWLDELLASGHGEPAADAYAHFVRGFIAVLLADPASARPALQRAMAGARDVEAPALLVHVLALASIAESMAGDRASSKRLLEAARDAKEGLDDLPAAISFLQARSLNGFFDGDLDEVRSAAGEGARLSRGSGDLYRLEMMLFNLGAATMMSGDLEESKPFFTESLGIARQIDDRIAQYLLLDVLGCHAAGIGKAPLAARLLGAAATVRTGVGASVMPVLAPLLARAEAMAITSIGRTKFEAEFGAGQRLNRAAAISLALGEPVAAGGRVAAGVRPKLLGPRESEVAALVAGGLTNKEIGAQLFISDRTVESHVRNILDKIGSKNRAQIARWVESAE